MQSNERKGTVKKSVKANREGEDTQTKSKMSTIL